VFIFGPRYEQPFVPIPVFRSGARKLRSASGCSAAVMIHEMASIVSSVRVGSGRVSER
jgi:hypothetical protein